MAVAQETKPAPGKESRGEGGERGRGLLAGEAAHSAGGGLRRDQTERHGLDLAGGTPSNREHSVHNENNDTPHPLTPYFCPHLSFSCITACHPSLHTFSHTCHPAASRLCPPLSPHFHPHLSSSCIMAVSQASSCLYRK